MPSPLHRLARALHLALACLALVVIPASATAQPETDLVSISIRGATRDAKAQRGTRDDAPAGAPRAAKPDGLVFPPRATLTGRVNRARPPHRPTLLYLQHRTFLR
jgi:hypothetical protein